MASTQLGTSTVADSITHGRNLVVVSSGRLYAVWNDGTDVVYQYSDNNGASWSSKTVVWAGNNTYMPTAFYDWTNDRLNIVGAGGNNSAHALKMRAITSNVSSGTPGSLTADTTIDAGGANAGVCRPYAFISDTASNPRYWIIAVKITAATTYETRVWYVAAGSAADTGGNWSTTNFTNLGGNSDANSSKCGVGGWWPSSGVDKVTLVFQEGSNDVDHETVTFDPTAATPTPGTVGAVTGSAHQNPVNIFGEGAILSCIAAPDYFLVTSFEATSADVNFFKTVNGTTWTQPNAGWIDEVMGRHALASNFSTKIWLVYATVYGALATIDEPLEYRELNMATDTWGSPVSFSDTQGNGIAVAEDAVFGKLNVLYRGSTGSPFTHRSDFVQLASKVNLLRDLLENPVAIDAALWVQDPNGGSITPTSTGVVLVTPTSTNVVSVNSLDFWDAIASRCFIELADPGADTKMSLSLRIDADNHVAVDQDGADLIAIKRVAGTETPLATVTYNPSTMKFWSIREAGGTTFWEYSTNGLTWTLLHSVASPINLSAIKPRFSAWSESGISETAKFRRLNFPGSQVAVPTTDSVDGSWTDQAGGTSLFAAIDETVPSDSDYIRSPIGPANSGCRVKLATLADPTSSDDHRIHWRTGKDFVGGPQINMTVKLYQGGGDSLGAGTLIATFARNNVGQALTTFVESLSGAEADAITNYADLYLEFFANQV